MFLASIRSYVIEEVNMELYIINLIISVAKLLIMIGSLQNLGVLLKVHKAGVLLCKLENHEQFDLILTGQFRSGQSQSHKQTLKPQTKVLLLFVV